MIIDIYFLNNLAQIILYLFNIISQKKYINIIIYNIIAMSSSKDDSKRVVQKAVNDLLSQELQWVNNNDRFLFPNKQTNNSNINIDSVKDKYDLSSKQLADVRKRLDTDRKEMYEKVNTFTKDMFKKYGSQDLSLQEVLRKARTSKDKYDLSDNDFHMFRVLYEHKLDQSSSDLKMSERSRKSAVGKALGSVAPPFITSTQSIKVDSRDKGYVNEIVRIAEQNRAEHASCIIQSMIYEDMDPIVLFAPYAPQLHNIAGHIHPIIAAMFIPKIPILEDRMLNSNLAGIIRDRFHGAPIRYKPDFEFFIDLTTDRNDLVCDTHSVYKDLLRRVDVQEIVRKIVWNMRNGHLFTSDNIGFITSIDSCKMSPMDSPHLIYVRDEGTLLRRLLNIFSFRPTHVTTRPVFALSGLANVISSLTQLSMIHVMLPLRYTTQTQNNVAINLTSTLDAPHWFMEGNIIVPKQQSIIYSREVIFFYVNRRYQSISRIFSSTYQFTRLPVTLTGYDKLNDHHIDFEDQQFFHGTRYFLRSVVICGQDRVNKNLITIPSCVLLKHTALNDSNFGRGSDSMNDISWYHYDPMACIKNMTHYKQSSNYGTNTLRTQPIYALPFKTGSPNDADQLCHTRGTIFIYSQHMINISRIGSSMAPYFSADRVPGPGSFPSGIN